MIQRLMTIVYTSYQRFHREGKNQTLHKFYFSKLELILEEEKFVVMYVKVVEQGLALTRKDRANCKGR